MSFESLPTTKVEKAPEQGEFTIESLRLYIKAGYLETIKSETKQGNPWYACANSVLTYISGSLEIIRTTDPDSLSSEELDLANAKLTAVMNEVEALRIKCKQGNCDPTEEEKQTIIRHFNVLDPKQSIAKAA